MADGASCAAAGSGCIAAEDFLSPAVGGAAAETGWAEAPDLPLLGASCVAAAIGAGFWEFGARFGVKGAGSLLEVLLAMANPVSEALAVCAATVVALGERVGTGAVWRVAEPAVAAGSAVRSAPGSAAFDLAGLGPTGAGAELNDADSTGVELLTLAALGLGPAGCSAFGNLVTGAELLLTEDCSAGIGVGDVVVVVIGTGDGVVAGAEDARATLAAGPLGDAGLGLWAGASSVEELLETDDGSVSVRGVASAGGPGVKGAAETDGDSTIGDWPRAKWSRAKWSREKTGAPVGTGAWNRLSAGAGAGETGPGGIGGTGTEAVENGVGAPEGCVGRLGADWASPEAV